MKVIRWDWKAEPPVDKINEAIVGWDGPMIFNYVNTDSDDWVLIIAHYSLSKAEAGFVYHNWVKEHQS